MSRQTVNSWTPLPGWDPDAKSPALAYFAHTHIPRLVDTDGYNGRRYGVDPRPSWQTIGGDPIPANACVPERHKVHAGPSLPDMSPKQREQYLERQWARLARAGKQCKYHAGLSRNDREDS